MEFGKRHDTSDTADFCPRQLVTDLLRTCYAETGEMGFGLNELTTLVYTAIGADRIKIGAGMPAHVLQSTRTISHSNTLQRHNESAIASANLQITRRPIFFTPRTQWLKLNALRLCGRFLTI